MYSTGTNKSFANILISNSAMKLDDVCVHIELSNFKYIRIDVLYHESIGDIVQMYVLTYSMRNEVRHFLVRLSSLAILTNVSL